MNQAATDILKAAGYPTDCLVLDFETYFDPKYSLKEMSTIEYVQDKRFEILGVATKAQGPAVFISGERETADAIEWLQKLYGPNLEKVSLIVQNAQFDCTILARKFNLYPRYVVDLRDLAAHYDARAKHNLETIAKQLGIGVKGETKEFYGCTFRSTRFCFTKRRRPMLVSPMSAGKAEALAAYAKNDAELEWKAVERLLPILSDPRNELEIAHHTLELYTRPVLEIDEKKGQSIIRRMGERMNVAVEASGLTKEEISGNTAFERAITKALEDAGDNPQTFFKPCKKGYKLAEAKTDPEREILLNHYDINVQSLMAARVAIKSWPAHISRVENLLRQALAMNGRLCVPLRYYGAHTGRWAGLDGINLQNLGSRGDPLISEVREMIVPPAGHKLLILDAVQIEPRVIAWQANQEDLLASFAAGKDTYSELASRIVGRPVYKPTAQDTSEDAERLGKDRILGKVGILGAGYGMGARRMQEYASQQTGAPVELALAEKLIKTYRETNKKIVSLWYDVQRAFVNAIKYGSRTELLRGVRFEKLLSEGVSITLPSGRKLYYPKVRYLGSEQQIELWDSREHKWIRTWGGSLVENIVQAISRDVLREVIRRVEAIGYRVAMHCHDEVVVVAEEREAEAILDPLFLCFKRPDFDWIKGCPLTAEGKIAERYEAH